MNILEAEDVVKGLPDQVLFQYAQNPPPQIPQYLAVSEVQRRQEMRQRFQAQQAGQQQPTVKDQILQGGIAAAGGPPPGAGQPPMAPPGGAPPMAPPMGGGQPPVMAAAGGMMPYSMAGGRSVPAGTGRFFGGFGPEVVPRGDALSRRYGSENPGTQNFINPLLTFSNTREFLKNPDAEQFSDALAATIAQQAEATAGQNRGLRAPAGGAVGGGRGGGLPYGGPTSYAGMYESPRKKPTVTVEEIPQPPQGMYSGGMTPGGIVYMQQGRTTPSEQEIREAVSTPPRNRTERQKELARFALSSDQYNPLTSNIYQFLYGAQAAPSAAATPPVTPPATTAAPRPAAAPVRPPAVEAGIPAAGAALTANAPPAAAPAPPVAPPMAAAVTPPVTPPVAPPAAQPAGPVSDYQSRVDQLTGSLPGIMGQIQSLTPQVSSLTLQDLQRFAPKPFDDSEIMARREALINQLQNTGRTRRAEDIAAAERYRSEAEAPIKSAEEESRKTAIASTLMRLGAGLAAGNPAQGLANASEAVENIMTRAREQASAERRAVRQEFRQAEREATRGERDVANTVFQMQAQQITSDESKQRELTRDQMQFAQWAFGQIRDQGRDARQAYTDAMRLSLDISKTVQSVLNEELKNERISKDQYTTVAGALLRTVNETLRQNLPEGMDLSTSKGRQDLNDMATDLVKTQLQNLGISSPDNLAVTSFEEVSPTSLKVNGQTINFKTEEQANAFKKSIGR